MKTLFIILLHTLLFSSELQWVDEKIAAIKPARVGLSDDLITSLSNPFNSQEEKEKLKNATIAPEKSDKVAKPYVAKPKKRKKAYRSSLKLTALLNSSALINGKWYKRGERVGKYRLSHVGDSYVVLSDKRDKQTLSIKNKKKKLKFIND
jgi:hypothetical protein